MPTTMELVKAVCPDFPSDRGVKATMDRKSWYLVNFHDKTINVPTTKYLQMSTHDLDAFVESITAFARMRFNDPIYRWGDEDISTFTIDDSIDEDEAVNLIRKMHEDMILSKNIVALDIETRQIHWEDNRLLAVGFCYQPDQAIAITSMSKNVKRAIHGILLDDRLTFVWHNGKFDTTRLKYMEEIVARVDEDTMLMHYAQINARRGTHGLKDLGRLYLQAPPWDDELDKYKKEWCKKNKKKLSEFMYDDIPVHILVPYLHKDVIATFRLFYLFKDMARPGSEFIYRKLIEASNVYGKVELTGVMVDMPYLEELEFELEQEIKRAQKHMEEVVEAIWDPNQYVFDTGAKKVPKEFNINSPKQLKWLLETSLGTKIDSTDAATIEELDKQAKAGYFKDAAHTEFLEAISTLRSLSKFQDTYVQGYRKELCRDLRLRCSFNLHGTETGRLSASNPNLQNVPRNPRIKNLLRAAPGYRLVQLDYSQAELRVLAHLSDDDFMKQVYIDGKDLHSQVAIEMFGPDFTKEDRNLAKTINFGIAYGRGPLSIANMFGIDFEQAAKMIQDWFRPMPKVKAWIDNQRAMAIRGDLCTTPFGRERTFVVTGENLHHVQNEYTNTPIQSVASDLTMFSVLEIYEHLLQRNIDARVVLTVHDSIILEVVNDTDVIKRVIEDCTHIMGLVPRKYLETTIPFVADAEVGTNWGDLEKWNSN